MASGRAANRARWAEVVHAWRRSGSTQVAFAEAQGLELGTLRAWCRRLGASPRGAPTRPSETAASPAFVELRPVGFASRAAAELELGGGLVLRFRDDAAPAFVGAVVAAVRAGVC